MAKLKMKSGRMAGKGLTKKFGRSMRGKRGMRK